MVKDLFSQEVWTPLSLMCVCVHVYNFVLESDDDIDESEIEEHIGLITGIIILCMYVRKIVVVNVT